MIQLKCCHFLEEASTWVSVGYAFHLGPELSVGRRREWRNPESHLNSTVDQERARPAQGLACSRPNWVLYQVWHTLDTPWSPDKRTLQSPPLAIRVYLWDTLVHHSR